jgi:TolA-binding protein
MTALSEDLETLLEAERDIDAVAVVQRQRMFERLEPLLLVPLTLAAGATVSSSAASAASAASTTVDAAGGAVLSGALKAKLAAAVVSAALVGGAVGATGHAYLASPPEPVVAPAAPQATTVAPPAVEPVPSVHEAPETGASPAPSAAAVPSPGASVRERPPAVSSLRAERLLLEAASAALMRGDRESAILALRRHAQRFPEGVFAEERDVLLAKARAASGAGTR